MLVITALALPLFSGCVGQLIKDSDDRNNYKEYRMQADRLNLEREKAGLKPADIPTFDEWRGNRK